MWWEFLLVHGFQGGIPSQTAGFCMMPIFLHQKVSMFRRVNNRSHTRRPAFPKDCGQSSLVPSQFLGEGLYLLAWPSPSSPGDGGIGITTDLTAQGVHQVPARGSWSPWSTLLKPFRWWWRGDTSSAQEQTKYLGVFLAPKDYGKFGQLIIMW